MLGTTERTSHGCCRHPNRIPNLPLCEATCGLEITIKDDAVRRIRGDRDNVFSPGFICPMSNPMAGICSLGAAS
ncbi:MAG: hypothetical protein ACE1Z0_03515 [Acidimicrobiia bacterium]